MLKSHGISVVRNIPAVGEDLQDHLQTRLQFECTEPVTANDIVRSHWHAARGLLRFLVHRDGIFSTPSFKTQAYVRCRPEAQYPEARIQCALSSGTTRYARDLDRFSGFHIGSYYLWPESRGSIHLKSADPLERPKIRVNYLSHPRDREVSVLAFKMARKIAEQPALQRVIVGEVRPGPEVVTSDEILDFIQGTGETCWHPISTCRMGSDAESVVDEELYHRAECLTHVGDSQAVRSLTQCGEPMRFAMAAPIDLRNDFDSVSLRRLAKRTRDATQSRRLLALAEVYDGGSRTDASRIGGVGLQIIRDWVLRFNARGLDGLVDGKSPGAPSKLNADHRRALAEVVEAGPVPAVDGVVRWRRKDLARWLLETFAISLDETTVGRELKALGFAKISARPRHYAQNELAVEAFKKNFPAELAKIRARLPKGVEIELWWQDEARIGQKNKLTRRWARRGTRPRAPRDQRTEWAYIFGAICPAKGKGAGLVMPWCDTDAMAAHLIEISAAVDPGAQAVLIVDQAGWHLTPKLAIPDNITVLALPPRSPELNPVENVWQFMRDNWLSNRIFKSYEDIVALCCQAWNNLIDQPWKIMSLGMRKWAHGF